MNKMNNNIKIIAGLAAMLLPGLAMTAQNLNPTVEVTNIYQRNMVVEKPLQTMAVPDSLLRFDLDFDYSVFDNPYKGAYEFQPYRVDMRPQAGEWTGRKFYLRAGAGYALKPTVDVVWSPVNKNRFKLDMYASHKSYFGNYRNISAARKTEDDTRLRLVSENQSRVDDFSLDKKHFGYDSHTKAGVNGKVDFDKLGLFFDLGYVGIHTKDTVARGGYNAVDFLAGIKANIHKDSKFYYDAAVGYRFAADGTIDKAKSDIYTDGLRMNDFTFKGNFGPIMNTGSEFLLGAELALSGYSGLFTSQIGYFSLTPKYLLDKGRWHMSLGIKLSTRFGSDEEFEGFAMNQSKSQIVYPNVNVSFDVIRESMNLYFKATGGDNVNAYSSLKEGNHFLNPLWGRTMAPLMNNSVEKFNLALGLRGNISSAFRYDVSGGLASWKNGLIDVVYLNNWSSSESPVGLIPGVRYAGYDNFYVNAAFVLDTRSFVLDGKFSYNHSDMWKKRRTGFEAAPFSAFVRGRYNWNNRIYVGGYVDFASNRKGCAVDLMNDEYRVEMEIPEYVNIGLSAEYVVSRKISVWAQVDNLLNMTVQRVPLYPDSGISGTVGVAISL